VAQAAVTNSVNVAVTTEALGRARGGRRQGGKDANNNESFFNLLMVLVGNLVSCLRAKSEIKNVTSNTAFYFNSKDPTGERAVAPQCLSHHIRAIGKSFFLQVELLYCE
jgi:hypothetical protein